MFNVIIINDAAYVTGGAGQVAITSAIGLAKRGVRVVLFTAVGPAMPELADAGVEVVVVGQREILKDNNFLRAAVQGIWNRKAQKILERTLRSYPSQNTIIHLHAWVKALSSSVVRVAAVQGYPLACTLHDYFSSCPNGGFFNYKKNQVCSLAPLSCSCILSNCDVRHYSHKLWRVTRHWVQRQWGRMPGSVPNYFYNSSFSLGIARQYLPKGAAYHQVPPVISLEWQPAIDPTQNRVFAFIGRLTKEKGCLIFAEAARKAKVPCMFIGDGDIRQEIVRINPAAIITGWLTHSEVVQKIKLARAIIYPTLWFETFGMTVLESAGVGVPAIVSDGCAAKELIEDGVSGLMFKSGDPQDLAEKLICLQDDQLVKKLGQNSFQNYWRNSYTLERHIETLLNAYQEILQRKNEEETALKRT